MLDHGFDEEAAQRLIRDVIDDGLVHSAVDLEGCVLVPRGDQLIDAVNRTLVVANLLRGNLQVLNTQDRRRKLSIHAGIAGNTRSPGKAGSITKKYRKSCCITTILRRHMQGTQGLLESRQYH